MQITSQSTQQNEHYFHTVFDNMLEGVQILDHDWRYLYLNAAAERHNRRPNEELLGRKYMDMWPGIESTHVFAMIKRCMEARVASKLENRFVYPDGAVGWFELSIEPIPEGVLIMSFDISNRVRAERRLTQMKRLYATLSQVNQTIVRVQDPAELYQTISDVAVKFGEFSLAWIGLLDEACGDVRPVAANGLDVEHWPFPIFNINQGDYKDGLAATAMRTSRVMTSEDIQSDERTQNLQDQFEKYDYHSLAAVPFRLMGKTIGVLNLISREVGLFKDEQEMRLLEEMGLDISFALDTMETEKTRREWEERYRRTLDDMLEGCQIIDYDWRYVYVNDAVVRQSQSTRDELLHRTMMEMYPGIENTELFAVLRDCMENRVARQMENQFTYPSGTTSWFELSIQPVPEGIFVLSIDITERKQAIEKLQANERMLKLFVENAPAAIAMFDREMKYLAASHRYLEDYRLEVQNLAGRSHYEVFPEIPERWKEIHRRCLEGATEKADEDPFPRGDGSLDWVKWEIHPWYEQDGKIGGIILFSEVITARKEAEDALLASERQMKALVTSLDDIVFEFDEQGTYLNVWTADDSLLAQPKEQILGRRLVEVLGEENSQPFALALKRVFASGDPEMIEYSLEVIGGQRWFLARISPIRNQDGHHRTVAMLIRDITERKRAEIQVQLQLQRLSALSEIDRAISASLDMRLSLDVLLNKVISQLGVDAASILLYNDATQTLEDIVGKGFRSLAFLQSRIRIGEGYAGRVGSERKLLHITDLAESGDQFKRGELLKNEGFVEYVAVPLVAKGMLKGVLEAFNRTHLNPDQEWLNYLETLGGQAAIAIDGAQLFESLQRSNQELITAYDATIEGWSHAMDLRDKETEGHTQRVTELTLKLAERMGVSDQEQAQMRRGALLHDIGKLGVPDYILHKPGKLSEEEWAIMRQHPNYAYKMLLPISYLQPALDIPYCHHEKWDGSGYPRGLKFEQIPLAARIFAVVDVWDALRSDRPYRARWTEEQAREYIREQSGEHFDPHVVGAFLSMIDSA